MFNGVPFDLAFQLDDAHRAAFSVVFAGFHGRRFNWDIGDFEDVT